MIKKIFQFAEYIFTITSLIFYTDGILNVIFSGGFSEGDLNQLEAESPENFFLVKIIFPYTYAIAFLLLVRIIGKSPKVSDILFRNPYVLMVVGFAVISITWSELPEITITRSIALVGTTVFGIYLANRYTLKEQIVLLGHTCLSIVVLSIIFAVALPQYGIMGAIHAGDWRGIYAHKNDLGRLMVLSAVVFAMQPRESSIDKILELQSGFISSRKTSHRTLNNGAPIESQKNSLISSSIQSLVAYTGLGLSIGLLLLSRSSGAIVNLILLLSVVTIFKISQLRFYQRLFAILFAIVVLVIVAVLVIPTPEVIFASLGKGPDLSGRSNLWDILFDMLSKNPWLGFGYGAFWEKYRNILAPYNGGWAAPHAHNGFIDLTLSIGLIGLALFAISYIYTFTKALNRFRHSQTNEELWPLILLVYIPMSNISETGLFAYNNIFWLLYVMVGYSAIARSKKTILAVPESRVKKPILALPESPQKERKALPEFQRKKPFLALPKARDNDPKNTPIVRREK